MKNRLFVVASKQWVGLKLPVLESLAAMFVGILPAAAQSPPAVEGGSTGKLSIVPRVSVSETLTNNVFLSGSGRKSELITQISPGIRIVSRGGRISGSLDYSLDELLYANGSSGTRSLNALNATGTMEVIDKSGYVDFSGVVSQQVISAFGAPTSGLTALNGNSAETSVFRISPHMRGRISGFADYEARYSLSSSRSAATFMSDVDSQDMSVKLNSTGSRVGSGWTFGFNRQSFDYTLGRSTQAQQVSGQLNYPFNEQFGAYVKGSHESNNYVVTTAQQGNSTALGINWTPNEDVRVSVDKGSDGSYGVVASWNPSKRTNVAVTRERRLYGETHSIALSYRTPNTAWAFSDVKTAVTNSGQSSAASAPSLYDVLYSQFIATEHDPVKREQYDASLQANGIKPNATAVSGFLASSVSLRRQQQLSFAVFGARSTASFAATRSSNSRLDSLATGVDDFSNSPVVTQNGLSANFSYRLTPRALLSIIAARQVSTGSLGQAGTSLRSVNVNLSTNLTKETSASVGARKVVFDSTTAPYTETAVIGSLNVQF